MKENEERQARNAAGWGTDSVQFQEIEKKHFHSDLNGINIQINKYKRLFTAFIRFTV